MARDVGALFYLEDRPVVRSRGILFGLRDKIRFAAGPIRPARGRASLAPKLRRTVDRSHQSGRGRATILFSLRRYSFGGSVVIERISSVKSWCRRILPRAMRDWTVPRGISNNSAISL